MMHTTPFSSILDALPKLGTYDYCGRLSDTKLVYLAERSSDNKFEKYGDNVHSCLKEVRHLNYIMYLRGAEFFEWWTIDEDVAKLL